MPANEHVVEDQGACEDDRARRDGVASVVGSERSKQEGGRRRVSRCLVKKAAGEAADSATRKLSRRSENQGRSGSLIAALSDSHRHDETGDARHDRDSQIDVNAR